jgi:hypothetical protein
MVSQTAASHCLARPLYPKAPQVLDMEICHQPPSLLHFDDNTTNTWDIGEK